MALGVYGAILGRRQVQVVVAASVVAGLAIGLPLAVVLMVQGETGSFASAGAVTGAFAIASAISGPLRGRLIDVHGQSRTLPSLAIASVSCLVALVFATTGRAPLAVLLTLGAVGGAANVPLLPSMRTLWADLVESEQLETAYAIQAVLVEIFFIAGPLAAGALIALGSPAVAVLALAGVELVGVLAFAATPASRAWRGSPRRPGRAGAIASRGMRTLAVIDIPFGMMFGTIEVAVPAFAAARGEAPAAGILLAALAVGSMAGGIVYGSRARGGSLADRYVALSAASALLVLPLAFADSILTLGVLMVVAGVLVAPVSSVAFGLLDHVAPAGTATEATSWLITAYQLGLAAGTPIAGLLVDHVGTTAAFLAAFGLAVLSAAVAFAGRATLQGG